MKRLLRLPLDLIRSGHLQFHSGGFRLTAGEPREGGPWAPDPSPRIDQTITGKIAIAITVLLVLSLVGFMIWAATVSV